MESQAQGIPGGGVDEEGVGVGSNENRGFGEREKRKTWPLYSSNYKTIRKTGVETVKESR